MNELQSLSMIFKINFLEFQIISVVMPGKNFSLLIFGMIEKSNKSGFLGKGDYEKDSLSVVIENQLIR